jgi:hypothetical protein
VDRGLFLNLARRGCRFPIATDLALHDHPDPDNVRRDPQALGRVIAASAQRWGCPLGIPLMDLRLEKADLLSAFGIPEEESEAFHFNGRPPASLPRRLFLPAHAAAIGAIRWVRDHTSLIPCGMAIGPFSLLTRLLSDPITPLALLARGLTAEDDPAIDIALRARQLALDTVTRSVRAQLEAGSQAVMICEPSASIAYLSPRQMRAGATLFEDFVLAPNRALRDLIESAGALLFFHNCGELTNDMVAAFARELRPAALSLGSSRDLAADAALVPRDVVLYGNLPTRRFYSDSALPEDEVARLTASLLERMHAADHPHICGSECDVLHVPGARDAIDRKLGILMNTESAA